MSTSNDPARTTGSEGRHPVNIPHLVMGVAFLGLALVWALVSSDAVALGDVRWLLPIPWVSAGAVGLIAIVAPSRRRTTPAEHPADSHADTPADNEEIR